MCGRFDLHSSTEPLALLFAMEPLVVSPRYNIAPSTPVVALTFQNRPRWAQPTWGFRTRFSGRDKWIANARRETVCDKPLFRKHLKQRVLLPANGFYEWRKTPTGPQPYYCAVNGEPLFCFGGLMRHAPDGPEVTILTTDANETMRPIHHRMPVIVPREHFHRWLDPDLSWQEIERVTEPLANDQLVIRPVSRYVNDARHEGPQCLAPPQELF
jgi:putative SOS response-associated peptidase YedK